MGHKSTQNKMKMSIYPQNEDLNIQLTQKSAAFVLNLIVFSLKKCNGNSIFPILL